MLQEWCAEGAVVPTRLSYCNNLMTMLHVARAGLCACLVPAYFVAADVEAGILQAPTAAPPLGTLKFFVATRLESVDPAIAEIASIVAEVTRLSDVDHKVAQPVRAVFGPKGRGPR